MLQKLTLAPSNSPMLQEHRWQMLSNYCLAIQNFANLLINKCMVKNYLLEAQPCLLYSETHRYLLALKSLLLLQ